MSEQEHAHIPKPWAVRIEQLSALVRVFTDCLEGMGWSPEEIAIVYTEASARMLRKKHGVDE